MGKKNSDNRPDKVLNLQKLKEKKEKEKEEEETVSFVYRNLDTLAEGVGAQLGGIHSCIEILSQFVQEQGSDEEKEAWQKFQKSFFVAIEKFDDFWFSVE